MGEGAARAPSGQKRRNGGEEEKWEREKRRAGRERSSPMTMMADPDDMGGVPVTIPWSAMYATSFCWSTAVGGKERSDVGRKRDKSDRVRKGRERACRGADDTGDGGRNRCKRVVSVVSRMWFSSVLCESVCEVSSRAM